VTVVEESRDRVIALGADAEDVVVFTNVDDSSAASTWAPDRSAFRIAYAGGFGPHRGIDTLLRALPLVRDRIPDARLVLMGAGEGESELRELAVALQVSTAVDFTGWVGLDEMRRRLASASVGAVPHERSEHTETTVPHKLFQYMAMGLPVVVTDCAPLARIVGETGCGRVATAGDAASLADAIVELSTPSAAEEASRAGIYAVGHRYNLEVEGRHLVDLYEGLARPSRTGG
jgi:glycosyltransferase involved in cell wall biosynthesis